MLLTLTAIFFERFRTTVKLCLVSRLENVAVPELLFTLPGRGGLIPERCMSISLSIGRFVAILAVIFVCCSCTRGADPAAKAAEGDRPSTIESMYSEYRKDFPDIGEIRATELLKLRDAGDLVLVDVREPKERAVSVIRGSISSEEFEASREAFRGKDIVVYCAIGHRSGLYVKELAAEGIAARNLAGSILAWTHAGGEVVTFDGAKTNRVHVYGSQWDLLPEGFEAVW
jgi:sodium/bile acid cotransporter 7